MLRVAAIGECMIELRALDAASVALAYGGDTANTAVYLKRAAGDRLGVDYVTALGDDPWSDAMLAFWHEEGIGTGRVSRLPGRLPGLYAIRLDEAGERRFFYWRSASAARELFRDEATPELAGYALLYLSLITVSILSGAARDRLADALDRARENGARVAFDTNYRPAGWPDAETARREATRYLARADIVLPTADDEAALFGDRAPEDAAARYRDREAAIKLGAGGCIVVERGIATRVPVPHPVTPVDTTAAGDAFNAGYLAARLLGAGAVEAARAGHLLAAAAIRHPGAIIPRAAMPALPFGG
jgi:2-dehydro-3-deoxygluconokinase